MFFNKDLLSSEKDKNVFLSNLPKYMSYHSCPQIDPNNNVGEGRPLAVILGWFLAPEKPLLKYRDLWFKRGFDVLIVRITFFDALIPPLGSQVVAKDVVKIVSVLKPEDIVFHSFSIGGYIFGEVLNQLFNKSTDETRNDHSIIINTIKGVVMDSTVVIEDAPIGFSRIVANNRVIQLILEKMINLFMKFTQKHYKIALQLLIDPPVDRPGLMLYSKDDEICNYKNLEQIIRKSVEAGNDRPIKCWDKSGHVLHYKYHQKEYEEVLDKFLSRLKLKSRL